MLYSKALDLVPNLIVLNQFPLLQNGIKITSCAML